MATIIPRKNGAWQAKIRRAGCPPESKTFPKRSEAEAWARDVEAKMDKGVHVSASAVKDTFADVAKKFRLEFAPHHYRGPAWTHKLDKLAARLNSYKMTAITPIVVAGYRDDRLRDPDSRYKAPTASTPRVSPATVKSELDLLSKVFDVAMKEFGIPLPAGNPVLAIRKPRGAATRSRRLTKAEFAKLEKACARSGNPWLAPCLVLAVETAMRQGELLSLEWKHVHENDHIALLADPDKIKNAEPRAVPLSDAALEALKQLPGERKGRVVKTDRMTLYKAFERACASAQIENYTWHDLRHEALSRIAERGDFTVIEMAAVSGHKTLQMLKRYTHLQAGDLALKLSRLPPAPRSRSTKGRAKT